MGGMKGCQNMQRLFLTSIFPKSESLTPTFPFFFPFLVVDAHDLQVLVVDAHISQVVHVLILCPGEKLLHELV